MSRRKKTVSLWPGPGLTAQIATQGCFRISCRQVSQVWWQRHPQAEWEAISVTWTVTPLHVTWARGYISFSHDESKRITIACSWASMTVHEILSPCVRISWRGVGMVVYFPPDDPAKINTPCPWLDRWSLCGWESTCSGTNDMGSACALACFVACVDLACILWYLEACMDHT